jgi:general secretion pathway protein G
VTQIAAFSTALDAYEVGDGFFPKGSNGLKDLVTQPADAPSWPGPYLKEIPKDPWQHDYIYQCPGQHNTNAYDLMSMGPNGRAGDKDDITNWARS